jgi:xanthine/CO dehydrogenase XdhC/CoxF family maturation factor
MDAPLSNLLPLYQRERAAGRALALCVLLETAGSTYSKAGALLLITADGDYAGLLSGGCLEGDLREHARDVIASGRVSMRNYDMRGPDELLWGLGSGCEGAMNVLLLRVGPANDWQPLAALHAAWREHRPLSVGIDVESGALQLPLAAPVAAAGIITTADGGRVFALPLELPPRVLLLGGGPDAGPVCEFAARLGWKVTVADHRSAYAEAARFPSAERVLCSRPELLAAALPVDEFSAAVVMSHHLASDLAYLRVLARSAIPFVGLLGPAPRRDRLYIELGADAALLGARLHAPVGLAIGGRSSAAIALAIVAEVQAWLHGCVGNLRAPRALPEQAPP